MRNTALLSGRSRTIFDRLDDRGIDYEIVKSIVTFQIPQYAYFFVQQFGRRSLRQVLGQIERWKEFLKVDLLLSGRERADIIRSINQIQFSTCRALIEANSPRIGHWDMRYEWIPSGKDETGGPLYIWPALRITAQHQETGETRCALIPQERLDDSRLTDNWVQKAFEELGLWEQLEKGSLRRYLVSSRKPQGWPMYTQTVIPQLYEFLVPNYSIRGHHSEKRDITDQMRNALFPKELLEDMLDILRMEHPHAFDKTTINQLKAGIQRHLAQRTKRIKSPL